MDIALNIKLTNFTKTSMLLFMAGLTHFILAATPLLIIFKILIGPSLSASLSYQKKIYYILARKALELKPCFCVRFMNNITMVSKDHSPEH